MIATMNRGKNPTDGVVSALDYDYHVQHLLTLLGQVAGDNMRVSLRRVDVQVAAGKQTRIQALSREIARLEAN